MHACLVDSVKLISLFFSNKSCQSVALNLGQISLMFRLCSVGSPGSTDLIQTMYEYMI